MPALLLEMSIFCVRAGCTIRLVSYGAKHALQSHSDKQFVFLHAQLENYRFCKSNDHSTIGDIFVCIRVA